MTHKQRMKAINLAIEYSEEYRMLVARKDDFGKINRVLTEKEMDEYIRIKQRIEQILENYLL